MAEYWPVMITAMIIALCLSLKTPLLGLVSADAHYHNHTEVKDEQAQTDTKKANNGMCNLTKQLLSFELSDTHLIAFTDSLTYQKYIEYIIGNKVAAPPSTGQLASLRRHLINCVFHE